MFEIDLKKHSPTKKYDNNYLCYIRKRLITITPEEEVRQSVINFLINERGYPIENISVEVPMTHFLKGAKGRADIIITDNEQNVICLIECKEPKEVLSDIVLDQLLKYDEILRAETMCIVIGNYFYFYLNEEDPKLLTDFPTYKTLIENGQVEYFLPEIEPFEKFSYLEPIPKEEIDLFYEEGVFGEDTDRKYLPFLFNLYNFYIDESDKLNSLPNIEDIGIKVTKYGNASGGHFFGSYRAFHNESSKAIVTFSISSITRGENYPVNTALLFGVDIKGRFHLSLELRVDKYIFINGDIAEIIHDGTITIGKIGSAKRSELIEFIRVNKPELLKNDKVYLGSFNYKKEIKAELVETKQFVNNCIEYALIRDKFREIKKGSS
jgi:hypothetical protein